MKPFSTIKEIKNLLKNGEITEKEVINFYLDRIKKHDNKFDSFLEVFDKESIFKNITSDGPLSGIPGLLKDNICQKNRIVSCGSKFLENYVAPYDATITKKLKSAGAPILGRANMDEFAMGSSGEYSGFKEIKNPWDTTRVPGGSSAGPAAAVAAGLVPWSLGSETGGSVRQPAAFCGVVGMYPTYGRSSRYGLVALTSSTDQIAPITRTVYDNAYMASIIFGHDPKDATSIHTPQIDFTKDLDGKLPKNIKIGVLKEAIETEGLDPQIKKSLEQNIETLRKMGATISYINLPNLKNGISVYFVINRAEAASNLKRFDGTLFGMRDKDSENLLDMYVNTRHDKLGKEVKRRILLGNYVLSSGNKDAYYKRANRIRAMIRAEFNQAFKEVDLIIGPTTSTLPFKLGEGVADPLALYLSDYFTVGNCITGLPAVALPSGFSKENLPMSFQFMGPRLSEGLIYKVAHAYEQETQHFLKTPTL